MVDQNYLTPKGKEELQRELDQLVTVRRAELAARLKDAAAQGDLRENADYQDAKEQQGFVEGRIQYLETLLRSATVIATAGNSDQVTIGSEVTIREKEMDKDETYIIVGTAEANPREGKISNESPIGSALLGHKKGDKVRAMTPAGEVVFTIRNIR